MTAPTSSNHTSTDSTRSSSEGAGALQSIRLVAQREIATRAKTRSFVISTVVLMLVIVVGLIVWKAIAGGGTDPERVGLLSLIHI